MHSVRIYRRLLENREFREAELGEWYFNNGGKIPLNKSGKLEKITNSLKYIEYATRHFIN